MFNKKNLFLISVISSLLLVQCNPRSDGNNELLILSANDNTENQIIVSYPAGKEIYTPGETILINWITSPFVEKVNIYLYRKSRLILNFENNLDNVGEMLWQIPSDIPYSNHYKIKLVNSSNEEEFGYSGMFGIQNR